MPTTRRRVLAGLAGSLGAACLPGTADPSPLGDCPRPGETVGAVTGPFPPPAVRTSLRGRPNPGPIRPEGETDLTLTDRGVQAPAGQIVIIEGVLLGPDCRPVADAEIQIWQADAAGHYNHRNEGDRVRLADLDPGFAYWGLGRTDPEGRFRVQTVVPGAYRADTDWWRPPHLHWTLRGPGRRPVTTQSFFDGDVLDDVARIRQLNRDDHILNLREGFEGRLTGSALETARRRLRSENVAHLMPGPGPHAIGRLTFRI